MNLDRFGFKAKSNQRGNYWLYASLDLYDGIGSYGVRYHFEQGGDAAFSPAWIDPETICQCTGLKDSEGNLIYENDYVKIGKRKGVDIVYCVCRYKEYPWYFLGDDSGVEVPISTLDLLLRNDKHKQIVVIGNKFDKEEK